MRRKKTDPTPQPPAPQAMPCLDVQGIINSVQAQMASAEIGRLQGALREAKSREMPPNLQVLAGGLAGLGLGMTLQTLEGILSKPGPEDRLREALERAEALEREGATPHALDEARAEVERLREKVSDAEESHESGSRAAAQAVSAMLPHLMPRVHKLLERMLDDATDATPRGDVPLPSTPEGRAQLWRFLAAKARQHGFGAEMLEQVKQVVLDARDTAPSPAGTAPSPAPEASVGPATAPPREKARRHRATRKPEPSVVSDETAAKPARKPRPAE